MKSPHTSHDSTLSQKYVFSTHVSQPPHQHIHTRSFITFSYFFLLLLLLLLTCLTLCTPVGKFQFFFFVVVASFILNSTMPFFTPHIYPISSSFFMRLPSFFFSYFFCVIFFCILHSHAYPSQNEFFL